jgi:hypothetical protein
MYYKKALNLEAFLDMAKREGNRRENCTFTSPNNVLRKTTIPNAAFVNVLTKATFGMVVFAKHVVCCLGW